MRSGTLTDDGYPWLAFSWENFRYSAGKSNRLNTDEGTDKVVGKGSWFPLLAGSKVADWANRCEAFEKPILIDPTVRGDVDLLDVDANGYMQPSCSCIGPDKQERVKRSIELYGLNLGNLVSARKRVLRDVQDNYDNLMDLIMANHDLFSIERLISQIRRATSSDAPYARTARSKLYSLPDGARFCAQPEDGPNQNI